MRPLVRAGRVRLPRLRRGGPRLGRRERRGVAGDLDRPAEGSPAYLALVELAEGPWMHTRLDGVSRDDLREGLPLRAAFEQPDEGESYVLFRP
ncbi:OB-fold domain-containing protein [Actinomadura madurae]|nr:OB-fold domain-containing protein [Actinomadura madurae]URN00552.1 OB-fold domain-containing protein [Actinomadura madurae]